MSWKRIILIDPKELEKMPMPAAFNEDNEYPMSANEIKVLILKCIKQKRMKKKWGKILLFRYFAGLTFREISYIYHESSQNSRRICKLATKRLTKIINEGEMS